MKFIIQILFIAAVAFLLELFLPWWSIGLAAFAGGFFIKSDYGFLAGFIAIALLWALKIIVIEAYAATPLADKVAAIFKLPGKLWLIVIACLLSGLVGGFGALAGSQLKKIRHV